MPKKIDNKVLFLILLIVLSFLISILMANFEKPLFNENSLDNPQSKNQNKPILTEESSDIAVILVHGLGATTFETKKLAEYLNVRNITAYQVSLEGHGADIYGLEKATSLQWYQSVENSFNEIQKPKKFIIGLSVGSLLALELSQKKDLNGIILLSVPITFKDKRVKYTPFLKFFKRFYHREIEAEHDAFYYENLPIKAIAEMVNYITDIKKILPQVTEPTLIIQSKNDPRLEYSSAQYVYDNIGSEKKEIMWINSSRHVLIIDYLDEDQEFKNERAAIFEKIYNFIINNSK